MVCMPIKSGKMPDVLDYIDDRDDKRIGNIRRNPLWHWNKDRARRLLDERRDESSNANDSNETNTTSGSNTTNGNNTTTNNTTTSHDRTLDGELRWSERASVKSLQERIMADKNILMSSAENVMDGIHRVVRTYESEIDALRTDIQMDIEMMKKYNGKCKFKAIRCLNDGISQANHELAIKCFTKAIQYCPDSFASNNEISRKAYAFRARRLWQLNRFIDAAHDYDIAISFQRLPKLTRMSAMCHFEAAKQLCESYKTQPSEELLRQIRKFLHKAEEENMLDINDIGKAHQRAQAHAIEQLRTTYCISPEPLQEEPQTNPYITTDFLTKATFDKNLLLVARKDIEKDEIVFYEDFLAFHPSTTQFCAYCHKQIGSRIYPCIKCKEVIFCNKICHDFAQEGAHQKMCLYTSRVFNHFRHHGMLAYKILANCNLSSFFDFGCVGGFLKFISAFQMDHTFEVSLNHDMFAYINLISRHVDNFITMTFTDDDKLILCNAIRLALIIETKFSVQREQFNNLLLLCYATYYAVRKSPLTHREVVMNKGPNTPSVGYGLGVYSCRLRFVCKPNMVRRLNAKTGKLEYIATEAISAKTPLSLAIGNRQPDYTERHLHAQHRFGLDDCQCSLMFETSEEAEKKGDYPVESGTTSHPAIPSSIKAAKYKLARSGTVRAARFTPMGFRGSQITSSTPHTISKPQFHIPTSLNLRDKNSNSPTTLGPSPQEQTDSPSGNRPTDQEPKKKD